MDRMASWEGNKKLLDLQLCTILSVYRLADKAHFIVLPLQTILNILIYLTSTAFSTARSTVLFFLFS